MTDGRRNLIVIGQEGMGKTTLMRSMALRNKDLIQEQLKVQFPDPGRERELRELAKGLSGACIDLEGAEIIDLRGQGGDGK